MYFMLLLISLSRVQLFNHTFFRLYTEMTTEAEFLNSVNNPFQVHHLLTLLTLYLPE